MTWMMGGGVLGGGRAERAIAFSGTSYLYKTTALAGVSDGKQATVSYWFRSDVQQRRIIRQANSSNASRGLDVAMDSDGFVFIGVYGLTGIQILNTTTDVDLVDGLWHHIIISFDLSNVAKRHIYIDDVDKTSTATWNIYLDHTAAWASERNAVMCFDVGGSDAMIADISDTYINFAYNDISVEATRRKWIDASLRPAQRDTNGGYGGTGQPAIWLTGKTSTWHENKGNGGVLSLSGTLATSTHVPVVVGGA